MPIIIIVVWSVFLLVGAWIGAFCVNYTLAHTLHTIVPFFWAFLISLLTGDLAIPAAVVVWVLVHLHILH